MGVAGIMSQKPAKIVHKHHIQQHTLFIDMICLYDLLLQVICFNFLCLLVIELIDIYLIEFCVYFVYIDRYYEYGLPYGCGINGPVRIFFLLLWYWDRNGNMDEYGM